MVVEKLKFKFFYLKTCFLTIFLPKTLIKHYRNRDKPIYGLKKPKNISRTEKQPKSKN
jgi:hypothetical protein